MTHHLEVISKLIEVVQGETFLQELNMKWADHNKTGNFEAIILGPTLGGDCLEKRIQVWLI